MHPIMFSMPRFLFYFTRSPSKSGMISNASNQKQILFIHKIQFTYQQTREGYRITFYKKRLDNHSFNENQYFGITTEF